MEEFNLSASAKEGAGKGVARKARVAGLIPAVVYGTHMKENLHLTLDNNEVVKTLNAATSENIFINLKVDGNTKKVIFKKIDRHPYKNAIQHIDFFEINADEEITVDIPIHFEGKAEGVKQGGIMQAEMVKIKVKCLPGIIPNQINIDVTELIEGHSIHVGDLTFPEGVTPLDDAKHTVVSIAKAAKEIEEVPVEGEAAEGEAAEGAEAAPAEEKKEG